MSLEVNSFDFDDPAAPEPEPRSAVPPNFYQTEIMRIPGMESKESRKIAEMLAEVSGPQAAALRHELIVRHLRFAAQYARITMGWRVYGHPINKATGKPWARGHYVYDLSVYRSDPMPIDDRIQEANEGLIRAAEKYNKGIAGFYTYASHDVEQRLSRSIGDDRTIAIPLHVQDAVKKVVSGREPADVLPKIDAIGPQSNRDSQTRLRYLQELRQVASIEELDDENTTKSEDHNPDDELPPLFRETVTDDFYISDEEKPEEQLSVMSDKIELDKLLGCLSERQRAVIEMRYGLKTGEPTILEKIAQALGVTRERVRQLEIEALNKMQGYAYKDIAESHAEKQRRAYLAARSEEFRRARQAALFRTLAFTVSRSKNHSRFQEAVYEKKRIEFAEAVFKLNPELALKVEGYDSDDQLVTLRLETLIKLYLGTMDVPSADEVVSLLLKQITPLDQEITFPFIDLLSFKKWIIEVANSIPAKPSAKRVAAAKSYR